MKTYPNLEFTIYSLGKVKAALLKTEFHLTAKIGNLEGIPDLSESNSEELLKLKRFYKRLKCFEDALEELRLAKKKYAVKTYPSFGLDIYSLAELESTLLKTDSDINVKVEKLDRPDRSESEFRNFVKLRKLHIKLKIFRLRVEEFLLSDIAD